MGHGYHDSEITSHCSTNIRIIHVSAAQSHGLEVNAAILISPRKDLKLGSPLLTSVQT